MALRGTARRVRGGGRMTAELDLADAQRLDLCIRLLVNSIGESMTKLYALVNEAKAAQIHLALGYASWPAYVADAFQVQIRLDREQRRELVGWLSGEGMSQRAIAEVVGSSVGTVNADLGVQNRTPGSDAEDRAGDDGVDPREVRRGLELLVRDGQLSPEDAEFFTPVVESQAQTTTGLDGGTYTRPAKASAPRRGSLTDTARGVGLDLGKLTRRLSKLVDDDRFGRNREVIGNQIRPYVAQAIEVLTRIDAEINGRHEAVTE